MTALEGRTTYAYDAAGRIELLENPHDERTSYAYDAAGRRTLKLLANGTKASYTYDQANRVTLLGNLDSISSVVISEFVYAYDGAGRRIRLIEADGHRTTWTYDDSGQLLTEYRTGATAWRHTFVYDESGNRLTKTIETGEITTSAYDQANRHLFAEDDSGRTTYGYDLDGNQSQVEQPSGDLTTRIWDFDNRLQRVELPNDDVHTFAHAIVRRDGTIQRVSTDDGTDVVRQVWDEDRVIAERDDLGFTTAEYTLEPAGYGNLVSQRRDDETSTFHFDALGSTRELTDDTASVNDEYQFEAFGEPQSATGVTESPYRWVGEQGYRQEQGLLNLRSRMYSASHGHFLSEDPSRNDELNVYRYTKNDPIAKVDPSGLYEASAVLATLRKVDPLVVKFMSDRNIILAGADYYLDRYSVKKVKLPGGGVVWYFYIDNGESNYDALKILRGEIRRSDAFKEFEKKEFKALGINPSKRTYIGPAPGTVEHHVMVIERRERNLRLNYEWMKEAGATDSEVDFHKFVHFMNTHFGPRGTADQVLLAMAPLAGLPGFSWLVA